MGTVEAISDRRGYVRKSLHSTVSVFDRVTDEYIGLVADFSQDGIMVTSSTRPIQVGETFEYMLLVQSGSGTDLTKRADFDAESMWCERTSPSFYGTGFQIGETNEQALSVLEACCS